MLNEQKCQYEGMNSLLFRYYSRTMERLLRNGPESQAVNDNMNSFLAIVKSPCYNAPVALKEAASCRDLQWLPEQQETCLRGGFAAGIDQKFTNMKEEVKT